MKTLDTLIREVETEARRRLGTGFTITVRLELGNSAGRSSRSQSTASDQIIFNVKQVAEMVGKSESTVRGWCKDGTLPATKMGRSWLVSREALERLGSKGGRRLAI